MRLLATNVEVRAPLATVYNHWTRFEDFPRFMDCLRTVWQLDDRTLYWEVVILGWTKGWEAEILEQAPDTLIRWRSTHGTWHCGRVEFLSVDPNITRISLRIQFRPDGWIETLGDRLGLVEQAVSRCLLQFKRFVEMRRKAGRGWRGQIRGSQVIPP